MKNLSLVATGLLASVLALGCSSASEDLGDPNGEDAVDATENEVRAAVCTNPRRYFVTLSEKAGACATIEAANGSWVPVPVFSGAPADVQASICDYQWSGPKSSRPDHEAIVAAIGYGSALAPVCTPGAAPQVSTAKKIPAIVRTHAGSVGCDVCGIIRKDKLWAVLPPDTTRNKFTVPLSNGMEQSFQLANPAGAAALTVTLPRPPAGLRYVEGRVTLM